jgi:hypothetical protein
MIISTRIMTNEHVTLIQSKTLGSNGLLSFDSTSFLSEEYTILRN